MPNHHNPQWQAAMTLRLDFNDMLDRAVGPEAGLTLAEIEGLAGQIEAVHQQIQARTGPGKEFLGFLDLPYQSEEGLNEIQACADRLAALGDIHVVLGIGGSYLGGRAIIEALSSPYRNELSREARGDRPRVYFEGNNLDADAIHSLLDLLPAQAPESVHDTFTLNVISKSGGTIETAVAFRLFRAKAQALYGANYPRYVIATTDQARGALKTLANQEGFESFIIPDDVGGRFSVLTPVGLLPAAVAGIDIKELVAGAQAMAIRCSEPSLQTNPAYLYAALMHLSYKAGRNVSLMASWSKRLEFVGYWYDQLCAESLGKQGGGRIPLASVNTRDLHARGQQVQEGPKSVVVTNLFVEKFERDLSLGLEPHDPDGLNYLAGWSLSAMQRGAMEGTRFAYARAGRPSITIQIPEINAYTLGQLFYLFKLATLAEGYLQEINPLDQPGVEAYKKFMFGNLGRADMARYKAEFDARPKPISELII